MPPQLANAIGETREELGDLGVLGDARAGHDRGS